MLEVFVFEGELRRFENDRAFARFEQVAVVASPVIGPNGHVKHFEGMVDNADVIEIFL